MGSSIADATTLTEAGYVGEDVENIILRLLQNADYDVKRARVLASKVLPEPVGPTNKMLLFSISTSANGSG